MMSIRHHFVPRGSGPLPRSHPRQCVLLTDQPIAAMISSVQGNQAIVESDMPLAIGTRVELHHPEAGMLAANVVDACGRRVSIAFNAGNRGVGFALTALSKAARLH